jgi:hypothetical protein
MAVWMSARPGLLRFDLADQAVERNWLSALDPQYIRPGF